MKAMKSIILFCFLLSNLVILTAADYNDNILTCPNYSCQTSLNGVCNETLVCTPGYTCTAGQCVSLQGIGGTCKTELDCKDHQFGTVWCQNNTCQKINLNKGLGESCDYVNQCNNKYTCFNQTNQNNYVGVCIDYLADGQQCNNTAVPCGPKSICNLGYCVKMFSINEGEPCSTDYFNINFMYRYPNPVCDHDLYCNITNEAAMTGTCVASFSSSLQSCYNTSCTNPLESCSCVYDDSTGFSAKCIAPVFLSKKGKDSMKNLIECSLDHNCIPEDPSCCSSDQCDAFKSINYQNDMLFASCLQNTDSHCSGDDHDWSKRTKIIALIIGGTLLGFVVVFLAIYFAKRKREGYAPIQ